MPRKAMIVEVHLVILIAFRDVGRQYGAVIRGYRKSRV